MDDDDYLSFGASNLDNLYHLSSHHIAQLNSQCMDNTFEEF